MLILLDTSLVLTWLAENYLLALYEGGRDVELMQLLEIIDITKFYSLDCVEIVFKALGKLKLEALVEKFLLALKAHGMFMSWKFPVNSCINSPF